MIILNSDVKGKKVKSKVISSVWEAYLNFPSVRRRVTDNIAIY